MAADSGARLRPIRTTRPASKQPFAELGRGLDDSKSEDSENASAIRDGEYEPLTPASRAFCNPYLNVTILVTFGLKTSCNIEALKEGLKSTLLRHKRFSSVVVSQLSFS